MPDTEQIAKDAVNAIAGEIVDHMDIADLLDIARTHITKAIRRHAFELAVELSQDAAELAKRFRDA